VQSVTKGIHTLLSFAKLPPNEIKKEKVVAVVKDLTAAVDSLPQATNQGPHLLKI